MYIRFMSKNKKKMLYKHRLQIIIMLYYWKEIFVSILKPSPKIILQMQA